LIRRSLQHRSRLGARFIERPSLMVAQLVFNKDFLLSRSLQPFLSASLRHLVVFADGCSDRSAAIAHRLLCGPDHLVVVANDRHEVANNRLALDLAIHQGCEYLIILQDDDLYPPGLAWVDYGLELFQRDPLLVVLGFNTGLDFLSFQHAPDSYLSTPFRRRPDVHADAVGIDDAFLAIRYGLPPHPEQLSYRYCQAVYRAPLMIRVGPFARQGGFDSRFAPFQDDDTHFCLRSWVHGHRCALVTGLPVRRDMGIGGMRLMGHIATRRAHHTLRNIRYVYDEFGDLLNSGAVQSMVDEANRSAGLLE
jgi:glycosyltransferase involved in cell wall biosynthesis